ncbi:MAG: biotin-dependent carboxyltransferase family protein [Vicinamibacterales bacterium]
MSGRTLAIVRAGLLTTVQDLGRWGHQASGVPVAGAMDTRALRQANALVGNPPHAAALEVTLLGPTVRVTGPCVMAVAGAAFDVRLAGRVVPHGRAFEVPDGAEVSVGRRAGESGARAYLAVDGGIDTVPVLGSRSTHLVSGMGGLDGRALAAGDVLPVGAALPRRGGEPPQVEPVGGPGGGGLRVLLGPQDDWFSSQAIERLLTSTFVVSPRSDRMGFRLEGPGIEPARAGELVSEPVGFGALQVPPGGAPILLMADRQTAGGYPKIATVIAADLPVAGQLAPGDVVRFRACTRADARAALLAREREVLHALTEVE